MNDEQVMFCTVRPTENWLGISKTHIQGWMNDLNMLLSCFRENMPVRSCSVSDVHSRGGQCYTLTAQIAIIVTVV